MIDLFQSGKYVFPLNSIDSSWSDRVGPKAARLGDLIKAKNLVPNGFVITTAASERFLTENGFVSDVSQEHALSGKIPTEIVQEIHRALEHLDNGLVVVRSSATAEDWPESSFAGMYDTFLNLKEEQDILEAVKKCWASAFAPRVAAYARGANDKGLPRMGVILQQQVPAEAAGVIFTLNPITGNPKEVRISAVKGLGDRLVSGEVTADEWAIENGKARCIEGYNHAISKKTALRLAHVAEDIEKVYRRPQDIEWAISEDRIFVLQARPITSVPEYVLWEPKAKGGWLRHFRLGEWLGEPVTPLFASWLLNRLDMRFHINFQMVTGLPPQKPTYQIINGWYYAQGNPVPANLGKFLWVALRHLLPALILRPRRLAIITV